MVADHRVLGIIHRAVYNFCFREVLEAMSQTHYADIERLRKKLRSRRSRKRMGKMALIEAREKLYLSGLRHRGIPGYAR